MNITIEIKAPEMVNAINALAQAIGKGQAISEEPVVQFQVPNTVPAAVPTAPPVQQQQQQTQPTQPVNPPSQPVQQPQQANQGVPTSAPQYDMNQLAVAATQLMDAGKQNELLGLLGAFGAQSLMQVPQEQYGAFATKLRELGAKI
ncbi:hypothetical protein [Cytobacillus purgationiresistens]|uniref:FtsZ-interacting cell division protein ZipA n=1 Tax=Cytobacillus purgationiresistens TaxID=863449 RepID=A0ABU0AFD1_9BACI|nr:hypothetical protein [Cytobacillus purgationiresistens]MDQ0269972.1 FtsZ-interacting cell division protein ZipA [Cytobacillus purgationiresistens]